MVTFYVWQISVMDMARDGGYGACLPPWAQLSDPHGMPSTLCTADHAAEPEAKVLNSIPAGVAGLKSISGMY